MHTMTEDPQATADPVDVVHPEGLEPNYILLQCPLSQ